MDLGHDLLPPQVPAQVPPPIPPPAPHPAHVQAAAQSAAQADMWRYYLQSINDQMLLMFSPDIVAMTMDKLNAELTSGAFKPAEMDEVVEHAVTIASGEAGAEVSWTNLDPEMDMAREAALESSEVEKSEREQTTLENWQKCDVFSSPDFESSMILSQMKGNSRFKTIADRTVDASAAVGGVHVPNGANTSANALSSGSNSDTAVAQVLKEFKEELVHLLKLEKDVMKWYPVQAKPYIEDVVVGKLSRQFTTGDTGAAASSGAQVDCGSILWHTKELKELLEAARTGIKELGTTVMTYMMELREKMYRLPSSLNEYQTVRICNPTIACLEFTQD